MLKLEPERLGNHFLSLATVGLSVVNCECSRYLYGLNLCKEVEHLRGVDMFSRLECPLLLMKCVIQIIIFVYNEVHNFVWNTNEARNTQENSK